MTFPTQVHIEAAQTAADRVFAKTGFYCWPSAALVQALIESTGWTALSGENNGFGIKANPMQMKAGQFKMCPTTEVINGRRVHITAPFASYATLADAYEAHAMLFVRVKLYAAGLKAKSSRQFLIEIGPHYATEPNYAADLIADMDRLDLYKYDAPAHAAAARTIPVQPSAHAVTKTLAPGAAGAVVAAGGAVVAAAHGGWTPFVAALCIAAVAVAFAAFATFAEREKMKAIPALPPVPVPVPPAAPALVVVGGSK